MQITVTIPDEVAAQVRARGLTPENFVEKLIADQTTVPESGLGRKLADLERFFEEMAAYSGEVPILPVETLSRESLYRDHD